MPIAMLSFNEQFPAKVRSGLEERYLAERDRYLARGDKQGAAWMAYGLGNTTHLAVTGEMFGLLCEKRGDPEAAFWEYREGLRYGAINTNASNIMPHLYHLGRLMAQHDFGSAYWAVTLLTLVQTHPDTQKGWFALRKGECERWLKHLQTKMPRDRFLAAVVNGREMNIVEEAKRFIETTVSSSNPAS